jgi:Holliday junction resolvase RusA-like endonuclease
MTPESRVFRFSVTGIAAPKGSTKAFVVTGKDAQGNPKKPRAVTVNDNPRTKGWQTNIANCAALELTRAHNRGFFLAAGNGVTVQMWFYLPRPKDLTRGAKAGAKIPHTKKPDLDKLARATKDALTGVLWGDDAQVVNLLAYKRYADVGEAPRVDIAIRRAGDGEL